ncbi:MAG: L-lactate MFS transporter [Candidatus Hadarchaeum sp.]|uniref:L-lactate MFS transporter n=1 Tax=Candidatus Hadarchaeum sp. TaxID=2883567 RepID=UPI003D109584
MPCGFAINLTLGVVYAWSVFLKPLMGEFGWTAAETSLAFTILLLTFAFVMIPAGRLNDKIGPRKVASAGGLLLGLGFFLTSFTSSLPWLYLTYGFIAGAGVALAYVTPIATCVKWFPDKKGLITGIIICGFGLSSAFLAPLATYLISTIGWKTAFQLLGITFLVVAVGGAQGLRVPPPGWCPEGWKATGQAKAAPVQEYNWQQMLRTKKFWMIWVMYTFGTTSGLGVIGHVAKFAQETGMDALTASLAVSVLAIFNGLGRISWGGISDRIGWPKAMTIMFIIQAAVMFFLIGATGVALFIAVAVVGFCFGGNLSMFPSATADLFGTKYYGINYGFVFTAYGIGGVLGPYLSGYLFDLTKSYLWAFQIAGILCAVAVVISLVLRRSK